MGYLIRLDQPKKSVKGYQARISLPGRKYRSKFFADSKHQGRAGAYEAAMEWLRQEGSLLDARKLRYKGKVA